MAGPLPSRLRSLFPSSSAGNSPDDQPPGAQWLYITTRTALIYVAAWLGDGAKTEARGVYRTCSRVAGLSYSSKSHPVPIHSQTACLAEEGGKLRATLHGRGCWRFHPHPIPVAASDPSPTSHRAIRSLASTMLGLRTVYSRTWWLPSSDAKLM